MIKPIFSEKSLADAKANKFTFKVARNLSKFQIKALITDLFGVTVVSVSTLNYKGGERRTIRGRKVTTTPFKKAIVELKAGEKISLWDTEKKEVKKDTKKEAKVTKKDK